MALKFDLAEANIKVTADNKRLKTDMKTAEKTTKDSATKMQKSLNLISFATVATAAMQFGRVISRVGRSLGTFITAAAAQEEAVLRLTQALKTNSDFTAANLQALEDQAAALQKVTKFGNETTEAVQAQLISIGKLRTEGILQITPAVLDFATAMGMDVVTAGQLVAKTLGSDTNALSRYGIQLDMTKTGTERVVAMTKELNNMFGGAAGVSGYSYNVAQAANAWGDVKEEIGFIITESRTVNTMWKTITKMMADAAAGMDKARERPAPKSAPYFLLGGVPGAGYQYGLQSGTRLTDAEVQRGKDRSAAKAAMMAQVNALNAGTGVTPEEGIIGNVPNEMLTGFGGYNPLGTIGVSGLDRTFHVPPPKKAPRAGFRFQEGQPTGPPPAKTVASEWRAAMEEVNQYTYSMKDTFVAATFDIENTWANMLQRMLLGMNNVAVNFRNIIWTPLTGAIASAAAGEIREMVVDNVANDIFNLGILSEDE